MTFSAVAADLFADYGQNLPFKRMNDADQRRVIDAFMSEHSEARERLLTAIQDQLDHEWNMHRLSAYGDARATNDDQAMARRQAD